jgi:hypothetical protein
MTLNCDLLIDLTESGGGMYRIGRTMNFSVDYCKRKEYLFLGEWAQIYILLRFILWN